MKDEHKQTKNNKVYVYSSFKKVCERFVRLNVVLNRTVVVDSTVTDVSTTCAVVIFRVKVSCITSVDGTILWLS